MPELATIYDYMRAHALPLGERILEQFPALHQAHDALSPRLETLLRRPFPAQAIAIMGLAKRWQQARTVMVVAECGTGKTLISLGAIHVRSEGKPFTTHGREALEPWFTGTDQLHVEPLPGYGLERRFSAVFRRRNLVPFTRRTCSRLRQL